jgi:hypothetical protein
MTVAELIAFLKTCPDETLVCMPDGANITGGSYEPDEDLFPVVFLSDAEND